MAIVLVACLVQLRIAEISGQEFSSEERTQLLHLAHESIYSESEKKTISLDPPTASSV